MMMMSQKGTPRKSFSSAVVYLLLLVVQARKAEQDYLGKTGKHLFHFVQITDLHITHDGSADRMEQFEEFCQEIIKNLVKPPVTIVSGDLVNSVSVALYGREGLLGTGQYEEEWKLYRKILDRTNVTQLTKWLDLRGNHDTFMDARPDSPQSFYRIYSHQGHAHSGSYEYTLTTKEGDSYSFIGIDLCPRPGLGRPFNFYGYLSQTERNRLKNLSEKRKNSTSIIYFGHYPLSFTYSSQLDEIMQRGLVYLNGHLHAGIKHLYARHANGLLELELGDWKRKRRFRIVTIDGGLLSFEDYRYGQSIYAVISNPKAAKFCTSREPFDRLRRSTHIRIVIFSKLPVRSVAVSIDGKSLGSAVRSVDHENLYILPWNTSAYSDDQLHSISVQIADLASGSLRLEHEFSLSLSTVTKLNRSRIILTIHQPTLVFSVLLTSLCVYLLILCYYRYQSKQQRLLGKARCSPFRHRIRSRLILLCSVDWLFYSLIALAFYHFLGPWYLGFLTEGQFGVVFLWGILLKGGYLPPDTQILVGTFQLYFCVFPLTFSLSSSCYYRYQQLTEARRSGFSRCWQIYSVYVMLLYTIGLTLLWSFLMTVSYKLAWFISPFGLSLAIFFVFLYVKSLRLKLDDFQWQAPSERHASENNPNDEDNFNLIAKVNPHLSKAL